MKDSYLYNLKLFQMFLISSHTALGEGKSA